MNEYNEKNCDERHDKLEKELENVWNRFKTLDGRLWAIIVLLVFNLGGVIISIMMKSPGSP